MGSTDRSLPVIYAPDRNLIYGPALLLLLSACSGGDGGGGGGGGARIAGIESDLQPDPAPPSVPVGSTDPLPDTVTISSPVSGAEPTRMGLSDRSASIDETPSTIETMMTEIRFDSPGTVAMAGAAAGLFVVRDHDTDEKIKLLYLRAGQALDHETLAHRLNIIDLICEENPNIHLPFTLTVTDLNDTAPVFTSKAEGDALAENAQVKAGTAVYTAQATPDVATDKVVYSLKPGTGDIALFAINKDTGVVSFRADTTPNHEGSAPADGGSDGWSFMVTARISGSVYFWQEVQIALRDVDIEGTAEADHLSGEGAGEVIFGLNDTDTIEGGGGNDQIWGRAPFAIPGADPANIIGRRGDTIFGNSGNDIIYGGQGNDLIFGGPGNDMIYGVGGFNTISGGPGRDIIDGGNRWSTPSYKDFVVSPDDMTGVHIDLSVSMDENFFRAVERHHTDPQLSDLVRGIRHIEGSKFNDRLTGDNRVNFLKGENGNDILSGNGGADTLWGGSGDDMLNGGGGADTQWASAGDDILNGGKGADRLYGEKGQVTLTGGAGADKFSLNIITNDSYDDTNTTLDFDRQEGDRVVVPTMNALISKLKINSAASAADKEIRIMVTAATEEEGGGAKLTFTYHDPTFDLNIVFLRGVDHGLITQDTVEDWFDVYRDVTISSDVL